MIRPWAFAAALVLASAANASAQEASAEVPAITEIRAALAKIDALVGETDAEIVRQLDAADAADSAAERAARESVADQLSDKLDLLEESRAKMEAVLTKLETARSDSPRGTRQRQSDGEAND